MAHGEVPRRGGIRGVASGCGAAFEVVDDVGAILNEPTVGCLEHRNDPAAHNGDHVGCVAIAAWVRLNKIDLLLA